MIHLYYGEGKGKTTCAVGLSLRMAGHGRRALFLQFLKDGTSGEIQMLGRLEEVCVICDPQHQKFLFQMNDEEKQGLRGRLKELLRQGIRELKDRDYGLLVLDEVTYPYRAGILETRLLEELVNLAREQGCEVCFTGREPDAWFMDQADYITCFKAQRHPYERGITAREGIEF